MPILCECGCGKETNVLKTTNRKYGWVKGHFARFRTGHNRNSGVRSRTTRWLVDSSTGCWNWQLSIREDGYGRDSGHAGIQTRLAHRSVYEQMRGPLSKELELDHLCRNRRCVNPDHLEPVSKTVNLARALLYAMAQEERVSFMQYVKDMVSANS
jgi:hypothetical protein